MGAGPRDRWVPGVVGLVLLLAGCSGSLRSSAPMDRSTGSTLQAGFLHVTAETDATTAAGLVPPPGQRAGQEQAAPEPVAVVDLRAPAPSPFASTPGATGQAVVTVLPERGELCVEITVAGLSQPTAAHLLEATDGGPGDVILALKAPSSGDGSVNACVSASTRVLERIERSPSRFSISVKTVTFPDGALRGPLG